ncbi:UNVERIFIED_CONTAM: hypothetical protein FKN15_048660 [Acipenser sinensis]
MPEIKVKHIVSCSSEDNTHKADNLLKADTYRKWKSARPGEKQISVILQVILVTSSFMSPTESRNSNNLNRVRMFGPDKLVKANAEKKWDRVKLICTQPYNKNISYGISFIRFHSPPDGTEDSAASPPKLTKLGQFRVKEEEPNTASLKPGSLFFNRAAKPDTPPKTEPVSPSSPTQEKKPRKQEEKRKTKTKGSTEVEFSRLLEGTVFVLSGFQNPFRAELRDKALALGAKYRSDWTPDSTHLICAFANTPKYSQVKSLGGAIVRKEWILDCHKRRQSISFKRYLMDGAESSTEESEEDSEEEDSGKRRSSSNKQRAGSPSAIHKRVTPKKEQQRENAERPGTSRAAGLVKGQPPPEEEDKFGGSSDEEKPGNGRYSREDSGMDTEDELRRVEAQNHSKKQGSLRSAGEDDPYAGSTDENTDTEEPELDLPIPELPGEEELLSVTEPPAVLHYLCCVPVEAQNHSKKQGSLRSAGEDDPYAGSTDENTDTEEPELDLPIPELPDFLTGKHFFLYGEFPKNERRMLIRYITAFNGSGSGMALAKGLLLLLNESQAGLAAAQGNGTADWGRGGGNGTDHERRHFYNFYAMLLTLLIFTIVFGNVLVCMAVSREKALQTTTNYLIVSLAVADLLVATLVMPWVVYLEVRSQRDSLCFIIQKSSFVSKAIE